MTDQFKNYSNSINRKQIKLKQKEPMVEKIKQLRNIYKNIWYQGEVDLKNSKPHGHGRQYYSNGDIFQGDFQHGEQIYGHLIFDNQKRQYKGAFKNQLFHGIGEEFQDKRLIFKGIYQNGYRKRGLQKFDEYTYIGYYNEGSRSFGYSASQQKIECGQWNKDRLIQGIWGKPTSRLDDVKLRQKLINECNQDRYSRQIKYIWLLKKQLEEKYQNKFLINKFNCLRNQQSELEEIEFIKSRINSYKYVFFPNQNGLLYYQTNSKKLICFTNSIVSNQNNIRTFAKYIKYYSTDNTVLTQNYQNTLVFYCLLLKLLVQSIIQNKQTFNVKQITLEDVQKFQENLINTIALKNKCLSIE